MPLAFINYRRTDSQPTALALRIAIESRFGPETTFLDVDDIPPGDKWPQRLREQLDVATVCLVVIGPGWLKAADEFGERMISKTGDWVRTEIVQALKRANTAPDPKTGGQPGLTIVQVLVGGLQELPPKQGLPKPLHGMLDCEVHCIRDESWQRDVDALLDVLQQHHEFEVKSANHGGAPAVRHNPARYLTLLAEDTSYIDIRGIQVGQQRVQRFPIEELYISLTTTQQSEFAANGGNESPDHGGALERETIRLEEALRHERLVIIGDPGSGKSTFLRRIAWTLCQQHLGTLPQPVGERLGFDDRTFPVLVRISELAQYLIAHDKSPGRPPQDDAPAWLPQFLGAAATANGAGLDQEFFARQLEAGATVLLDGLDEAPDRIVRERVARLIERVISVYKTCRFVVTSRPSDEAFLAGMSHARIDPLCDEAVASFLTRWCRAVYVEQPTEAAEHTTELLASLRAKPEIRRMARTPVMLTALAVVHWHERRLPEQRAELYDCILRWLARSRQARTERPKPERALELLRELALAMQIAPQGYQKQVSQQRAAELLASQFGPADEQKSIDAARAFVEAEELDSGIIVGRAGQVEFWHRTFQEYLAARAVAARTETGQAHLLWGPPVRVYLPEWREVLPLLAGILHGQGRDRVDNLVNTLIDHLGPNPLLADQARCAGLLGTMFRDLKPLGYSPSGDGYTQLLEHVTAIFDRQRAAEVPIRIRIEAADALGQAGDPRFDLHNPDYWVTIPAGSFLMGAQKTNPTGPNYDPKANKDESPVHEVTLPAFQIARYPLTVGQYRSFVEDDGYRDRRWWTFGGFGEFGAAPRDWGSQLLYSSRPVVGASWYEARAYCAWAKVRLPTEAEWERVARGTGTRGRKFPWGNQRADAEKANYEMNVGYVTPPGIFPRGSTVDGVADLAGNVSEWCDSRYANYREQARPDATDPGVRVDRVYRGGSWNCSAGSCRSAERVRCFPVLQLNNLGFRVARSLSGRAHQ